MTFAEKCAVENAKTVEFENAEHTLFCLADLKGSEKQIAWAQTLRRQMIEIVEDAFKIVRPNRDISDDIRDAKVARARLARISQIESAKWFIDHSYLVNERARSDVRSCCSQIELALPPIAK